ncbi:MAG: hypothetical protein H6607_05255 [Flavobacteriales bacterium]|nr:hypothetical protein [Flavobacteriales bacterium]
MGTSQKISQQKISRRIKTGAFVIVPLIVLGTGSIVYQFKHDSGFGFFDFKIEKLWDWASPKQAAPLKTIAVETENPLIPFIHYPKEEKTVSTINEREFVDVAPVLKAPQLKKNDAQGESRFAFATLEHKELKDIGFNSTPTPFLTFGKAIAIDQKENLIPENLKAIRSKWALGLSFSPGLSYRHLGYNDFRNFARFDGNNAFVYGQSKTFRNKNDKAALGFYAGLDIYYHINPKWSVQTGVYYASLGEEMLVVNKRNANRTALSSSESVFSNYSAVFDSPEMVGYDDAELIPYSNYYGFIEIPFIANFKAHQLGNSLFAEAQLGLSYSYLDHADLLIYDYETNKYYWIYSSKFPLLNKHFLNSTVGVQLSQYISKEVEVFVNPQFKYSLTSTFKKDYEIKQNQWITGLRMGMKVHL